MARLDDRRHGEAGEGTHLGRREAAHWCASSDRSPSELPCSSVAEPLFLRDEMGGPHIHRLRYMSRTSRCRSRKVRHERSAGTVLQVIGSLQLWADFEGSFRRSKVIHAPCSPPAACSPSCSSRRSPRHGTLEHASGRRTISPTSPHASSTANTPVTKSTGIGAGPVVGCERKLVRGRTRCRADVRDRYFD